MKNIKYHHALTDKKYNLIINSLNDLKNNLIAQGRYIDAVDNMLVKLIGAKKKKSIRKADYEQYEQQGAELGVWANRHRQYLKERHRVRYYNLLTSEKLYNYLTDVEERAENLFEQIVKSLAEQEQITEKFKTKHGVVGTKNE